MPTRSRTRGCHGAPRFSRRTLYTLRLLISGRALRTVFAAGATLTTRTARTTTASLSTLTAGTTRATHAGTTLATGTARAHANVFFTRQFAVAIFVELLQGGRGIRDFLFVNHAIAVGIERRHDGWHEPLASATGTAARTATTLTARTAWRAAFTTWGAVALLRRTALVLCVCGPRSHTKCQRCY